MVIDGLNKDLVDTDRTIIERVNQNPELFIDIPIKKFAIRANTAISTISKFVRRIGFENYRTFQRYIAKSYILQKENNFSYLIDVSKNDILNLKECEFFVISETIKKIDFESLDKLVSAIINSKKVWVIGTGNSFLAAKDLANSLNTIGLIAFATNDIFGNIHQLEVLNKYDLLIFISERFSQKEYYSLSLTLKKRNVKLGLITSVNQFFIDKMIDFVINFFAFPIQKRPVIVGNAKIQQIFINNILINAILKKKKINIEWTDVMKW